MFKWTYVFKDLEKTGHLAGPGPNAQPLANPNDQPVTDPNIQQQGTPESIREQILGFLSKQKSRPDRDYRVISFLDSCIKDLPNQNPKAEVNYGNVLKCLESKIKQSGMKFGYLQNLINEINNFFNVGLSPMGGVDDLAKRQLSNPFTKIPDIYQNSEGE